jgi:hypothetical protein
MMLRRPLGAPAMQQAFMCPSCFQQVPVADAERGQPVRCPHCRQLFHANDMQIAAEAPAPFPLAPQTDTAVTPPRDEFPQVDTDYREDQRESVPSQSWQRSLRLVPLRPTRGLAFATLLLLLGIMVLDLGGVPVDLAYLRFIDVLIRDPVPEPQDVAYGASLERIQLVTGAAHTLLTLVTAVIFLVWLHRSYANLEALGARDCTYSPGWAVGYFFIPILNLFRPYQVTQEIWKASDPRCASARPLAWKSAPGSALVGLWWTFWILTNIAAQVSTRISLNDKAGLPALRIATQASLVSAIAEVFAGALLIFVIWGITTRQEEKWRRMQEPDLDLQND